MMAEKQTYTHVSVNTSFIRVDSDGFQTEVTISLAGRSQNWKLAPDEVDSVLRDLEAMVSVFHTRWRAQP